MPQISVIVPVYKVEPYIRRCVDSILAQTFMDFELILVDDGSPDNCGKICDEYAQKDPRVQVIHQKNGGLSAARNTGIEWAFANSDSQWLTFVDSDDWVHFQLLEYLYRAAIDHSLKLSVCEYQETEGDYCWEHLESVEPELQPIERYYVDRIVNATVAWGKLYHKSCFEQIRYPAGKIHEDEFITYKILFKHKQLAVVDVPMYAYFVNPQGITKSKWTKRKLDKIDAMQEQYSYFKANGYKEAFRTLLCRYINVLAWQLEEMNKQEGISMKSDLYLSNKKRLMRLLLKHNKEFPFKKENLWVYERAFPEFVHLYWHGCAIIEKLFAKRNGKKNAKN